MPQHPEIDEINRRFKPLFRYLRPGEGACPFVIDGSAAKRVAISHHSAGRDATLVQIGRKWDGKLPLNDLAVTIRYASFVEGTAIVYDLMDETMQGKARPFVCDLTHRLSRMYMLLPYQIESASLGLREDDKRRVLRIGFTDARGEIIEAALPLELRVSGATGKLLSATYAATNRLGQFDCELPDQCRSIVVRSCLTGHEETVRL
jgi:hypothetical protein